MNKENVSTEGYLLDILLARLLKQGDVLRRERDPSSVQSIVDFLSHLEKLIIALDHAPTRVHAKLIQKWQHPA